jgi:hypothetical protein
MPLVSGWLHSQALRASESTGVFASRGLHGHGKILGVDMIGMAAEVAHGSCKDVPLARK